MKLSCVCFFSTQSVRSAVRLASRPTKRSDRATNNETSWFFYFKSKTPSRDTQRECVYPRTDEKGCLQCVPNSIAPTS